MIKKEKGITLVSLIIMIMLMLIISSTTINISLNRFKINNFSRMKNDIIFLDEKVSNYYLKYGVLPILRENDGTGKKYNYTPLDFEKNSRDNKNYYILDLDAMDGLALNYGEEGFKKPNESSDVYIINEATHTIYYAEGIELNGDVYYYLNNETNIVDNIPPTKPEIKVISGTKNAAGIYTSEVQIEIIPGKDNLSGVNETTSTITKDGTVIDIETLKQSNGLYLISENGTYVINTSTEDNSENTSMQTKTILIEIAENIS